MIRKYYNKLFLICITVILNVTCVHCIGNAELYKNVTTVPLCIPDVTEITIEVKRSHYDDVLAEWNREQSRVTNDLVTELQSSGYDIPLSLNTVIFPDFYSQDFLIAYTYLRETNDLSLSEVPYLYYDIEPYTNEENVTYGIVTIYGKSGEELLKEKGYDAVPSEIETVVLDKRVGTDLSDIDLKINDEPFVNYIMNLDTKQSLLIQTAMSLYGITPYVYGNKPDLYGNINPTQGLDCSGYTEWVYANSGYLNSKKITSTYQIIENCAEIAEPVIGCLGIKQKTFRAGEINHTGIYIGEGYYIHCNGAADGISITQYPFIFNFTF